MFIDNFHSYQVGCQNVSFPLVAYLEIEVRTQILAQAHCHFLSVAYLQPLFFYFHPFFTSFPVKATLFLIQDYLSVLELCMLHLSDAEELITLFLFLRYFQLLSLLVGALTELAAVYVRHCSQPLNSKVGIF